MRQFYIFVFLKLHLTKYLRDHKLKSLYIKHDSKLVSFVFEIYELEKLYIKFVLMYSRIKNNTECRVSSKPRALHCDSLQSKGYFTEKR